MCFGYGVSVNKYQTYTLPTTYTEKYSITTARQESTNKLAYAWPVIGSHTTSSVNIAVCNSSGTLSNRQFYYITIGY